MNEARDEFREARALWKRVRDGAPPGGISTCPGPGGLSAYLDGTARGAQRDGIEEHLRSCPSCVEAVASLRSLLRAGPSPVPSAVFERAKGLVAKPDADGRGVTRLTAMHHLFSLMRTSTAWAAAAALVAAACAAGFTMGQGTFTAPKSDEYAQASNDAQDPVLDELKRLEEHYLRGNLS